MAIPLIAVALTGLLPERLLPAAGSRVVAVSSNGHRVGRINVGDLQSERGYRRMRAYSQSKLANLMFTYELQRRLALVRAERRDGGAADVAGRYRPAGPGRPVLRAGRRL